MSASIVTHGALHKKTYVLSSPPLQLSSLEQKDMKYYEMDANQTQRVPLQPSGSSREINRVFLQLWTDDLPLLTGGNQAPVYMSTQ